MNTGNVAVAGNAPQPAVIDKYAPHLLVPTVDGILRRFNDEATRAEAALSAVVVLQALKAMGVFNAPTIGQALGGTFAQPAPGQRPVLTGDIAKRLEDELRKPAPAPETRLQNTGE